MLELVLCGLWMKLDSVALWIKEDQLVFSFFLELKEVRGAYFFSLVVIYYFVD